MYKINLNAYDSLIDGGVFFYNIGDIFDNENITKYKVCSDFGTMLKQSDFGWVGFNKWNIFLWDNT